MKVYEINHPLIKRKLTKLRNKDTDTISFRRSVIEITSLLSYEALKNIELTEIEIETPIAKTLGYDIAKPINLYPILRAGQGMVEGVTSLINSAKIGHIGLYRDEQTLKPIKYLFKTPSIVEGALNIVLDPMIATGGSLIAAIDILKESKISNIIVIAIVASKEALELIEQKHPDLIIYVAVIDEKLNDKGYIVPGLGDAGDRIFGTK